MSTKRKTEQYCTQVLGSDRLVLQQIQLQVDISTCKMQSPRENGSWLGLRQQTNPNEYCTYNIYGIMSTQK